MFLRLYFITSCNDHSQLPVGLLVLNILAYFGCMVVHIDQTPETGEEKLYMVTVIGQNGIRFFSWKTTYRNKFIGLLLVNLFSGSTIYYSWIENPLIINSTIVL